MHYIFRYIELIANQPTIAIASTVTRRIFALHNIKSAAYILSCNPVSQFQLNCGWRRSLSLARMEDTIYQFKEKTIDGEEVTLDKYKGNVCLIVNVSSKCGKFANELLKRLLREDERSSDSHMDADDFFRFF